MEGKFKKIIEVRQATSAVAGKPEKNVNDERKVHSNSQFTHLLLNEPQGMEYETEAEFRCLFVCLLLFVIYLFKQVEVLAAMQLMWTCFTHPPI